MRKQTYEVRACSDSSDDRLCRLFAFADDVLTVCYALGIEPVLDGSLAVEVYTQAPAITVRDLDLSCSEAEFPRLQRVLEAKGIACELWDWHVLQAGHEDLKVEFGATEIWMQGITGPYEMLHIGDHVVRMVNRKPLWELYKRGFDATAGIASQRVKHEETAAKLRALDADER